MPEHPFAKPPLAIDITIINPQSDGEGMSDMTASHQCPVGCAGEYALHFLLGFIAGQQVHPAGTLHAVAPLFFAHQRLAGLDVTRKESFHLGIGICQCRDDSLLRVGIFLFLRSVVVQVLYSPVQSLALQQVAGGGTGCYRECHYDDAGYVYQSSHVLFLLPGGVRDFA